MASVAKHIRKLRLERGLTQEELAERLHVTRQAVSNWERSAAQPDLDTLQAIAAALGVEVTEVIYGAPPPTAVTGAVRRRWLITGALAVLGAAVLIYLVYLLAFSNGAVGTRRDGFRYQLGDGAYRTTVYTLTDPRTVEVELSDPSSSIGSVLYQDDKGCTITVSGLEQLNGRWVVTFQAEGALSRLGGRLVSGCYEERSGDSLSSFRVEAADGLSLTTAVGGQSWAGELADTQPLERTGNAFSFYLLPSGLEDEPESGTASLTVEGLIDFRTWRNWRFWG